MAGGIPASRVQLLFVKAASPDAVLCHFRVYPSPDAGDALAAPTCPASTRARAARRPVRARRPASQTRNASSRLYAGNVTVRVDATGLRRRRVARGGELVPAVRGARERLAPFYGFPGRSVGAAGTADARGRGGRGVRALQRRSAARAATSTTRSRPRARAHTAQAFAGGAHLEAELFAG